MQRQHLARIGVELTRVVILQRVGLAALGVELERFGPAAVMTLGCAIAWTLVGFGHGALLAAVVLVGTLFVALWNSPLRATGHESLQAVRALASAGR